MPLLPALTRLKVAGSGYSGQPCAAQRADTLVCPYYPSRKIRCAPQKVAARINYQFFMHGFVIRRSSFAVLYKYVFMLLAVFVLSSSAFSFLSAQSVRRLERNARAAMQSGQYIRASTYWAVLQKRHPRRYSAQLQQAICLYHAAQYNQANSYVQTLGKRRRFRRDAEYLLLRARVQRLQEKYSDSEAAYRQYLRRAQEKDPQRKQAKKELAQLRQAQWAQWRAPLQPLYPLLAFASNLPFNSAFDESALQQHPNYDSLYFFSSARPVARFLPSNPNLQGSKKRPATYSPELYGNIWQIYQVNGNYQTATSLPQRYNSEKSEQIQTFLDGGYQIIYSQENSLYIDNYDADTLCLRLPLRLFQNCAWVGDLHASGEQLLLLSAISPDGYGGEDIYWSQRPHADSAWSYPENLGQRVNSASGERSPFLCADGRTLFFSSDRAESTGGYDVFACYFDDATLSWSVPQRVNSVNSAGDDLFFYPQPEGLSAFVSSNRRGGAGGFDLYALLFDDVLPAQMPAPHSKEIPANFAAVLLSPNPKTAASKDSTQRQFSTPQTADSSKSIAYTLLPMFYEQLVTEENSSERNISALKDLMTAQPKLRLVVSAHADELKQSQSFSMLLTLKQAEQFAQALIEAGIGGERILLRGGGTLYPVARRQFFDGRESAEGKRLNQRAELQLLGTAELPFGVKTLPISISTLLQPDTLTRFYEQNTGLHYKIEIRRTTAPWRHKLLETRPDVVVEQWANEPTVVYLCGLYADFDSARIAFDTEIAKEEFSAPTIVPYFNGWRLSEEEAQNLSRQKTDLQLYLEWKSRR